VLAQDRLVASSSLLLQTEKLRLSFRSIQRNAVLRTMLAAKENRQPARCRQVWLAKH
jgi:hypothetical protein